jgi:hypothetical protein
MEIVYDDDGTAPRPRILTGSQIMNQLLPLQIQSCRDETQRMEDEIREDEEKMRDEEAKFPVPGRHPR